jgi:hypothetical protein
VWKDGSSEVSTSGSPGRMSTELAHAAISNNATHPFVTRHSGRLLPSGNNVEMRVHRVLPSARNVYFVGTYDEIRARHGWAKANSW